MIGFPQPGRAAAILIGMGFAAVAFAAAFAAGWLLLWPDIWVRDEAAPLPLNRWMACMLWSWLDGMQAGNILPVTGLPRMGRSLLEADGRAYETLFQACGAAALLAGIAAYMQRMSRAAAYSVSDPDRALHVNGPMLRIGRDAEAAARAAEAFDIRRTGSGLWFASDVLGSREREARQVLIVGMPGSGKTQVLQHILGQQLERGDKIIANDIKGELTATWPTEDKDFILLSPIDKRSWRWDIATDTAGGGPPLGDDYDQEAISANHFAMSAACREIAAYFIPDNSQDAMWSKGAREIFAGLLMALHGELRTSWGFTQLSEMLLLPAREKKAQLEIYYPDACEYLDLDQNGEPTKTAQSFIVNLKAGAAFIHALAEAWDGIPQERAISLNRWMKHNGDGPRTIILQRSSEHPDLSQAWMSACIMVLGRAVSSPTMNKDDGHQRINFVIDEAKQLGKMLSEFQPIMEVGRDRGCVGITCWQDVMQIKEVLGNESFPVFAAMPRTKIILQTASGEGNTYLSDNLIGKKLVRYLQASVSTEVKGQNGSINQSLAEREEWVSAVTYKDIETLGVARNEYGETVITGLLCGFGRDVLKVSWPITGWKPRRPAHVPKGLQYKEEKFVPPESSDPNGMGDAPKR